MKPLAGLMLRPILAGLLFLPQGSGELEGPTAEDALRLLREGSQRYVAGSLQHPRTDASRREETASQGQKPFATILSCSDSRVAPEYLFDQGIGDLFVVRVAGNVADVDEIGTVEYGVDHLGTPLLVVLGHTQCGAVTAVAQKAEIHGSIPRLVDNIVPAVERVRADQPGLKEEEFVPACIRANVMRSIEDLLENSPALRGRAREGRVKILGALYDISNGLIAWMGEHPEQARILASPEPEEHHEASRPHGTQPHGDSHRAKSSGEPSHAEENPEGLSVESFLLGGVALLALGVIAGWSLGRSRRPAS